MHVEYYSKASGLEVKSGEKGLRRSAVPLLSDVGGGVWKTASMTAYLIVNADITDETKLAEYSKAAGPTLAGHTVRPLVVTNTAETIEGKPAGPRVVILEFPDRAALRAWYDSPAYQAVIGLRFAATDGFALIADGM